MLSSLRLAAALCLLTPVASFAQWPQWGGPHRDFKADAAKLADQWPEAGPKQLWKRDLGDGYSTILVDGGRLYTMYRRGDEEFVIAMDAATGKTAWEKNYAAKVQEGEATEYGPGPHSTPLIVGGRIYSIGVLGNLQCRDTADGRLIWSHDLYKEFNGTSMGRGYSSSPLQYRDNLIVQVGGKGNSILAFRLSDGSVVWKKHDFENTHASPIVIRVGGDDQLVAFMAKQIVGMNPADGGLLWSQEHPTQYGANISTPVWGDDGFLFLSSAYDMGSRVVRLTKAGGKTTPQEVWFHRKMRIHHGNAVRVGDFVYGSSGDLGPSLFTAVNVKTGDVAWQKRGLSKATCVYGDGKLILVDEKGNVALVTATPKEFKIRSKVKLLTPQAWSVPTLVGKTLYIRDRKHILALDVG